MRYFVVIILSVLSTTQVYSEIIKNRLEVSQKGKDMDYTTAMFYITDQKDGLTFLTRKSPIDKMDFLTIGIGAANNNTNDAFFLYDLSLIETDVQLRKFHFGMSLLNIRNSNLTKNDNRWAALRLGYGRTILATSKHSLIFFIDGKLGGTSVQPGEKLYDKIIRKTDEQYTGLETGLYGKLAYSHKDNYQICMDIDNRIIVGDEMLNINELNTEFNYYFNSKNNLFSRYDFKAKIKFSYSYASTNEGTVEYPSLSLACSWFIYELSKGIEKKSVH